LGLLGPILSDHGAKETIHKRKTDAQALVVMGDSLWCGEKIGRVETDRKRQIGEFGEECFQQWLDGLSTGSAFI
jgi:hypothetical protein